jgi:hypothetical protein
VAIGVLSQPFDSDTGFNASDPSDIAHASRQRGAAIFILGFSRDLFKLNDQKSRKALFYIDLSIQGKP